MKAKKITALALALLLLVSLAACQSAAKPSQAPSSQPSAEGSDPAGGPAADLEEVTLKFATTYAQGSSVAKAMERFKEIMEEKSGGKFKVELYTDGALGSDGDLGELMEIGDVDMAITGIVLIPTYAPAYSFFDAPFLYRDKDHYIAVLESEIGDGAREELKKANIRQMDIVEIGYRRVISTIPVHSVDDFPSLTIRMPSSAPYLESFAAAGATTAPMAMSEVFTALQTGAVNSTTATVEQMNTFKFYEVAKYVANTNHFYTTLLWSMREDLYQELSGAYKTMVDEAVAEAADYGTELNKASEAQMISDMEAAGVTFSDFDLTQFQEKSASVREKFFESTWTVTTQEEIDSIQ